MQGMSEQQKVSAMASLVRILAAREPGCSVTKLKIQRDGVLIEDPGTGYGTADRRAG